MPLALVTGPRLHLNPAATALARTGFSVVTVETPAPTALPDGPLDCYVQLRCSDVAPRILARSRTRGGGMASSADELVCRMDALAAVVSHLRPNASVILGVDENEPSGPGPQADGLAPDLLAAVALALLEDLGRPAARVAVLSMEALCRPAPAFARIDPVVGATQWEMPTPPLVSAP